MTEKQSTQINSELLEELRLRAKEQGRTEADLLEEAVSRYLDPRLHLIDLFGRIDRGQDKRGVEPISEEEAMRLAVEEQHAWRRERATG